MTRFYKAVDDLVDSASKALGRDLNGDEVTLQQDTLLMEWIRQERFDDLIDHALDEFDIADGEAFCGSLGNALAKRGDAARFERLFLGLAKTREAAFWRTWPKAREGHIGAMKESAMHLTQALYALAGLYHCYWHVKDEAGKERVKAEMLRLQARSEPPAKGRKAK